LRIVEHERMTLASSTSIRDVFPNEAAGHVDITVTTTAGTSPTVAADKYQFV
jgi:hypothetical protein